MRVTELPLLNGDRKRRHLFLPADYPSRRNFAKLYRTKGLMLITDPLHKQNGVKAPNPHPSVDQSKTDLFRAFDPNGVDKEICGLHVRHILFKPTFL